MPAVASCAANFPGGLVPRTLTNMRRNVQEICKIEEKGLKARSFGEQFGDFVVNQSGRVWFIALHMVWFVVWIILNSRNSSLRKSFDPFPFPLLTLVVSLESIFLSLFILMSQNRSSRQADERAHLDLQINLLAEHESTKALQLLQALCQHHGLSCAKDAEIDELISTTKPAEILRELKEGLPTAAPEKKSD
jgi:uncharacterized membrane protein